MPAGLPHVPGVDQTPKSTDLNVLPFAFTSNPDEIVRFWYCRCDRRVCITCSSPPTYSTVISVKWANNRDMRHPECSPARGYRRARRRTDTGRADDAAQRHTDSHRGTNLTGIIFRHRSETARPADRPVYRHGLPRAQRLATPAIVDKEIQRQRTRARHSGVIPGDRRTPPDNAFPQRLSEA